jgi:hypothetical protein
MLDLALSHVDIGAVFLCTLICLINGFIWYNPKTFFKIWWKAIGKSEQDLQGPHGSMTTTWILTVISSFVQPLMLSFVFAWIFPDGATAWLGIQAGIVIWLGFIAPTYLVNKLFAGHGWQAWAIETSNHLVNMMLFGLILSVWQ